MYSIFRKELNSFLNSLVAYIAIGIFLILSWLFVWFYQDTNVLDYGFADLGIFFKIAPYIFLLLIPAITMRSFADEFKGGTMELLFTKPLTDWQIILGKFLACFALVILALIPTIIYYFSIENLGNPVGNIDSASVWGSYLGLVLLGGVFCAIGLWASSMTDNQVVAFIVGATICYVLFDGISKISSIFSGKIQYFVEYLGLNFHYDSLGRGLVDSRNLIYFLSIIFIVLYLLKVRLRKN